MLIGHVACKYEPLGIAGYEIDSGDPCPEALERLGDTEPDPAGGAGYDGCAAFEA
jgi:hypothetical protein